MSAKELEKWLGDHQLNVWIKSDEGLRLQPYTDTVGKLTIGYGRNLSDNGISKEEAEIMFQNDLTVAVNSLKQYSWFLVQPDSIKRALINMCFNVGLSRLLGFRKMIDALIHRDYTRAAQEALNSKWARQVPNRAKDIAVMLRTGNNDVSTRRN